MPSHPLCWQTNYHASPSGTICMGMRPRGNWASRLGRNAARQLGLGIGRAEVELRAAEIRAAVVIAVTVPGDLHGVPALRTEARTFHVLLLEQPRDVVVHGVRLVPLVVVCWGF